MPSLAARSRRKPIERDVRPVGLVGDDADEVTLGRVRVFEHTCDLVGREELLDGRADRVVGFDGYPHEPGGAATFRIVDQPIELLAGERTCPRCDEGLDHAAGGEHLGERVEAGGSEHGCEVDELHAVAKVGLVGAEPGHHLGVGEPRERRGDLGSGHLTHDARIQRLDQIHQIFFGDERHLDVELGELEAAIGARGLVSQAPHDLVVAILPRHHQQLLELLRRWGSA